MYYHILVTEFGALAKLGSRLTGSQETRGSNPLSSIPVITRLVGISTSLFNAFLPIWVLFIGNLYLKCF